jgi:hypothetical protein
MKKADIHFLFKNPLIFLKRLIRIAAHYVIDHFMLGRRQVVRHGVLIPASVGSNPSGPAIFLSV